MLKGEVKLRWRSLQGRMAALSTHIPWETFKTFFLERYLPAPPKRIKDELPNGWEGCPTCWTSGYSLLGVWKQPQKALHVGARKVLLLYQVGSHGGGLPEEEKEGGGLSVQLPGRTSSLGLVVHQGRSEWKVHF
ncbi:Transposon Ty3-G Gag-Pol polyprotein [Sesbania bispinosa]|nr:Transposon Ty3-G Gag-Pol polyprotein [Sesbania bispinosa]